MKTIQRQQALLTLDLIDHSRAEAPRYGIDALSEVIVEALCSAWNVVVCFSDHGGVQRFWVGTERVLVVPRSLNRTARWYLTLREVALIASAAAAPAAEHEIFAFVGILPHLEVSQRGETWVEQRLKLLRGLGSEWYTRMLSAWQEISGPLTAVLLSLAADTGYVSPTGSDGTEHPNRQRLLYALGRIARARGHWERAADWFERCAQASLAVDDRETFCLSQLALGKTFRQRGDYPEAERVFTETARYAGRWGLSSLEGSALHTLMTFAAERGDEANVLRLANLARIAYGPSHPNLSALASDVALFYLESGFPHGALEVFKAVRFRGDQLEADKILTLSNIARAAAAVGDLEAFGDAWADLSTTIDYSETSEASAEALVVIGSAACALSMWDHAIVAASRAADLASQRREARWILAAEQVLETAKARVPVERGVVQDEPDPWTAQGALIRDLVSLMRAGPQVG